jgi:hypothetical protein
MYLVAENRALALTDRVLRISFDGCRSFVRWDPRDLPKAMINRAELPDFCAPKGQVDCSRNDFDFEGDRQAQYTNIQGVEKSRVSFTVRSKAFKPLPVLNIFSDDGGRTWQTAAANAEGPGSGAEGAAR